MTQKTVSHETLPQAAAAGEKKDIRQFVNFAFYKVDPAYRRLQSNEKVVLKQEFLSSIEPWSKKLMFMTYSLVGVRADCDLLFWRIGYDLESFQEMTSRMNAVGIGRYLVPVYSYLAMTKRSLYVDKLNPEHDDARLKIVPGKSKFLFVYPFVKTRDWYLLPREERQKMMDEHIRIGSKYVSVKLNTTYSFGLDDQEFVVAFETDEPKDFLDLVQELRESRGSKFTLRDTPTFTCVNKDLGAILDSLG